MRSGRRTRRSRGCCTTPPAALTRRTTSPRSGPTGTGKFDQGWDAYREETLRASETLGIVPRDTQLSRRPDLFPSWDSLSDAQKKLYARQMEVYAGYQENADWNVGRLLDAIGEMGDLDNTLIFYIWGDNGASMEGTLTGSFNETTFFNGLVLEADEQLKLIEKWGGIEEWGGFHTAPHFAAAWATPPTRRSSGASRWAATWAGHATRWSSPGRDGSSRTVNCARSSRTASTSLRSPAASGATRCGFHMLRRPPPSGTARGFTEARVRPAGNPGRDYRRIRGT